MTSGDKDLLDLWRLRSMNDGAIRSYYTYELLSKLLSSQEKSLLEQISTPIGIAASVLSIFAFLQLPASRDLILVAYAVAIVVIIAAPICERRFRKEDGLDDVVYLGIFLDEAAKYVNEITLAKTYDQTEPVTDFVDDSKDALRGTLPFLREKIKALRTEEEFPDCLAELGRSEKWVKELDAEMKSVLGEGFLD